MLNAAYSVEPQASFGFTVGQVNRFGWYLSIMTNGDFKGFKTDFEIEKDAMIDGIYPVYIDKAGTRLSGMVGGMARINDYIYLKAGIGYGYRALCWQIYDGTWVKHKEYSNHGVDLAAGLQLKFNKLLISMEGVTTDFDRMEAKIGVGYSFE